MHDLTVLSPPAAPYVGVRAYGAEEQLIFTGRDADVEQVGHLVANRMQWRILLLHGQTGCGKSSFLRAGLIPQLESPSLDTTVYRSGDLRSASQFIVSSADPMQRLAEVALALLRAEVPVDDHPGWLGQLALGSDLDDAGRALATTPQLMSRWFAALAPRLKRPLLLVIDQAEEVFTLRVDSQADAARERYFEFLEAYCTRTSWIQILISMRTEFYGRFDHELRRRLGNDMPVAPYYLEPFIVHTLEAAITQPLIHTYREGHRPYRLAFESGLPRRMAEAVAKRFPGPGALTGLQIICVRLWQQALARLPAEPLIDAVSAESASETFDTCVVTEEMFESIGAIENVIEDVVDQAIGDYCDQQAKRFVDASRLWRIGKLALGTLVTQQPGAAPTTKFIERDRFIADFERRLSNSLPRVARWTTTAFFSTQSASADREDVRGLVDHMLRAEVRVLREVDIVVTGSHGSTRYLALGHDVLSVGLVEAMARFTLLNDRTAAENRRVLNRMVNVSFTCGALGASLPWLAQLFGIDWLLDVTPWESGVAGVLTSFYVVMLVEVFRVRRSLTATASAGHWRLLERHLEIHGWSPGVDSRPNSALMGSLTPFRVVRYLRARMRSTGLLFREMTANARREAAATGMTAFPGGSRN